LRADGEEPELVRGQWTPLTLDGDVVAASVCTRTGAQPVVAHAAWRTDVETAIAVALAASTEGARAPVPLQEARRVAREARDLAGAG
jgi:deoxyinosine 3'endonuclease (endonuclease V)